MLPSPAWLPVNFFTSAQRIDPRAWELSDRAPTWLRGASTGGKRCHGLNIDITLRKCLRLTTVDWRWIYIMSVLRGGDWSSGRLKGLSSSIQQTFTEPVLPDRYWAWLLCFPKRMTQALSSKIWGDKAQWPIFIMWFKMSISSFGQDARPPPTPIQSPFSLRHMVVHIPNFPFSNLAQECTHIMLTQVCKTEL